MVKVLFVCTMNHCRSPAAEAVLRHQVADAGLQRQVRVASAGIRGEFSGEPPDARMQAAARRRDYDMSKLRARQVSERDFLDFDLLLAMERVHLGALHAASPPEQRAKIRLFLDYAPHLATRDVPDPYYGGPQGFELVLDLIEEAARRLRDHLALSLRSPAVR